MSELRLNTDGHIIKFGADNDVSLTHVADTGLLLNSTMQLQFNDASQNINAPSATVLDINATDEIELNATLVDINANVEISGTATTTGVHTFSAAPVFPDGSIAVADLDIDGATDIGAAIVDADLFIIDDGAGGTNRKVTASRLKTYASVTLAGIDDQSSSNDDQLTITDSAIVINEDSDDVDFRVETNGQTHTIFAEGSTDRVGILNSSPAVTLDVTGTIRASTGILFGTDTSADNTLDDYEEGSADLTIQDSAGANYSGSYGSVRNFRYQKIGNRVYGQFRVQTNSGGNIASGLTSSNAIQLSGLPFTSNAASAAHYGIGHAASDSFGVNFDGDDRDVFCYVEPGQSIIKFAFTHDNDEPERVLVSEIPVFSPGAYAGYVLAGNLTYLV